MRTRIELDEDLIDEARRLSGLASKREVVNAALAEFVAVRRQHPIFDLVGQLLIDPSYEVRAVRAWLGSQEQEG